MIGSKLKDLMKVNNIKNLAELEKQLFECDIPISTVNLNKIYNNISINMVNKRPSDLKTTTIKNIIIAMRMNQ